MITTPPRPQAPYRYLGLLRVLLASLVMLQHAGALLPPTAAAVLQPLEVGGIAVFCFFIVSGFVIAEAVDVFYADRPGAFMTNSLLRLVPTYVAAIALSAAVLALVFPSFVPAINETPITPERFALRTAVLNVLALFPIWKFVETHWHVPEILEQGWALRIEFLFYLAMSIATLAAVLLRVAVAPVLTVAGVGALIGMTLLGHQVDGSFIENAPYFIFGVAFYYAVSRRQDRWLPGAFCLSTCAFASAHLLGRAATFGVAGFPRDRIGELALLAGLTLIFAALATIPEGGGTGARRIARIDRLCGELTYPLYLMHWCIVVAAKTFLPHESWTSVVLAFAAAYAVAALAVVVVERPVARLRARVRRRGVPSTGTVPASPRPAST